MPIQQMVRPQNTMLLDGLHNIANRRVDDRKVHQYMVNWNMVRHWPWILWDEEDGKPYRVCGGQTRRGSALNLGWSGQVPAMVWSRADLAPGQTIHDLLSYLVHQDNKGRAASAVDTMSVEALTSDLADTCVQANINFGSGRGQDRSLTVEGVAKAYAIAKKAVRNGRPYKTVKTSEMLDVFRTLPRREAQMVVAVCNWWAAEVAVGFTTQGRQRGVVGINFYKSAVLALPLALILEPANSLPLIDPYHMRRRGKEVSLLEAPARLLAKGTYKIMTNVGQPNAAWTEMMTAINAGRSGRSLYIKGQAKW